MEERQPKRHKHEIAKEYTVMDSRSEVQTILSIQELDDALFERFKNLPTSSTSLIDFVEDAFDEIRRSLFNIEELVDDGFFEGFEFPIAHNREPSIHFKEDPEYFTVGEPPRDEEVPSFKWDWDSNSMVQRN